MDGWLDLCTCGCICAYLYRDIERMHSCAHLESGKEESATLRASQAVFPMRPKTAPRTHLGSYVMLCYSRPGFDFQGTYTATASHR